MHDTRFTKSSTKEKDNMGFDFQTGIFQDVIDDEVERNDIPMDVNIGMEASRNLHLAEKHMTKELKDDYSNDDPVIDIVKLFGTPTMSGEFSVYVEIFFSFPKITKRELTFDFFSFVLSLSLSLPLNWICSSRLNQPIRWKPAFNETQNKFDANLVNSTWGNMPQYRESNTVLRTISNSTIIHYEIKHWELGMMKVANKPNNTPLRTVSISITICHVKEQIIHLKSTLLAKLPLS